MYIRVSKSLSWLNCDHFPKIPEDQKISYIIKVPDVNANIKLVLKKYKSCLSGTRDGENIVFNSIPRNEAMVIIGMVQDKDQPLLDMVEDRTDGKEVKNHPMQTGNNCKRLMIKTKKLASRLSGMQAFLLKLKLNLPLLLRVGSIQPHLARLHPRHISPQETQQNRALVPDCFQAIDLTV